MFLQRVTFLQIFTKKVNLFHYISIFIITHNKMYCIIMLMIEQDFDIYDNFVALGRIIEKHCSLACLSDN